MGSRAQGCSTKLGEIDDNPDYLKDTEHLDVPITSINLAPEPRPLANWYLNCYFNSVLQSLFVTDGFLARLCDTDHYTLSGKLVKCVRILSQIGRKDPYIGEVIRDIGFKVMGADFGSMQCPHVFFLNLISGLSDEIKVRPELLAESLQSEPLNALFGVKIGYETLCHQCGYKNESVGQYISLSLPLPSSHHLHLLDCVSLLEESKPLEMTCPTCNSTDMTHTSTIQELGPILVIHFQRYSNGKKDNRTVSFSEDVHINVKGREETYMVYAVVYHRGSLWGGHCTADVKHDHTWISTNDSHISVLRRRFECEDAFLVFCRRVTS